MYKKINQQPQQPQQPKQPKQPQQPKQSKQPQQPQQPQQPKQPQLYHAQHKAQFNIETDNGISLNDMKGLSHNNFITNTNNIRDDYQKQHLNKSNNMNINLDFRG